MPGIEPSVIMYELDGEDRVTNLGADWGSFAEDNGWDAVLAQGVVGNEIWQYVQGAENQTLYRSLFARARACRHWLSVPIRCDSPDLRRFLELRLLSPDGSRIRIESHLLAAEARPRVILWDARADRSDGLLTACAWCKKLLMPDGEWVEVEEGICRLSLLDDEPQPRLTHSVCQSCRRTALQVV